MNNFFTQLEPVTDQVELQFTVKSKGGIMSVIVMPKFAVNDPGLGKIKHLSLSGPPADFDESFLTTIIQPFQQVAGIASNVAEFEAASKQAAGQTNAAKAEQEVAKNKREATQKEYKSRLESAERLVNEKDYKNALVHLNKALEVTESKDLVLKRIKEVEMLDGKGSLFAAPVDDEDEIIESASAPEEVAAVSAITEETVEAPATPRSDDEDLEEDIQEDEEGDPDDE